MNVKYLTLEEILRIHFQVIEDFGGSHGVRDEGRLESVILTILGGLTGIILGLLIVLILSHFKIVAVQLTWWSIILAFGVSTVIGIIFGYYPATRAAKLRPIDALKYE